MLLEFDPISTRCAQDLDEHQEAFENAQDLRSDTVDRSRFFVPDVIVILPAGEVRQRAVLFCCPSLGCCHAR